MTTETIKSINYFQSEQQPEDRLIEEAKAILYRRLNKECSLEIRSPQCAKDFLFLELAQEQREVFAVMFLDTRHKMISFDRLFFGTIDGASVYPREVAKAALEKNAAAVIFAHNHPSGNSQPSEADRRLTKRLVDALGLLDIRTLDHFVIGANNTFSFAEHGLI